MKNNYDQRSLKCVYISGDGAAWIKAGTEHIAKSVFEAAPGIAEPPERSGASIGDNGNDVSMFWEAGVLVTVGNALPEIQAQADFVCGTNDEDGPARFLKEWLLC